MLKLRVLTAATVLPLFLAAMFALPNTWWSVLLIAPLLVGGHEWAKLSGYGRVSGQAFLWVLAGSCGLIWVFASQGGGGAPDTLTLAEQCVFGLSVAFWCLVAPCCLWLKIVFRHAIVRAMVGLIMLVPTWLSLSLLQGRPGLLLSLLMVIWIADIAAYFAGRAIGRHKLAPTISPGKTWEGVGGALTAVTVYAVTMHFFYFSGYALSVIVVAFLAIGCFSVIGDLYESWIKRNAGVKDSGTIFPGHGGMLDRIDAITAALPLATLIFF